MKWTEIDDIKAQLRIEPDFKAEDDLLEMYGESAEETVLAHLNRTYEDIIEVYGNVPAPIKHATLMLCDVSYQYRSPISPTNISMVPYTFDILVKPYMRLTTSSATNNNNEYGKHCNL